MTVPSYRISVEDLPELDEKTKKALAPLLGALNNTLSLLIKQFNALQGFDVVTFDLTTGATVSDSFPLSFTSSISQPKVVALGNIQPPVGASLSNPFVPQGFAINSTGQIQVQNITNLSANSKYTLTWLVR